MSNARNLANIASKSSDLKAGTTAFFAMSSAPSGWIKANGAAVSRTAYADLFAAIGTTFGTGDGSTTFNVPDLRGEFPRGLDDGRGVDSGRAIGSAQQDQFQGHFHDLMRDGTGGYANAVNLTLAKTDSYEAGGWLGNTYAAAFRGRYLSDNTNGTPRLGSETRPRNVALLACIKY